MIELLEIYSNATDKQKMVLIVFFVNLVVVVGFVLNLLILRLRTIINDKNIAETKRQIKEQEEILNSFD